MMARPKEISVDIDVYAEIWRNHMSGDKDENDILKRILRISNYKPPIGNYSKRKWIDDVLEGFENIGKEGSYSEIYASVRDVRLRLSRRIPRSFEAIIRREIENHSSDSEAYLGKKDLFTAPRGIGAGYWAMR